jgi:hypothetical protein
MLVSLQNKVTGIGGEFAHTVFSGIGQGRPFHNITLRDIVQARANTWKDSLALAEVQTIVECAVSTYFSHRKKD